MSDITNQLDESIKKEFEDLKSSEHGEDGRGDRIESINTLYRLKLEQEKLDEEAVDKKEKRKLEFDKQVSEKKRSKWDWVKIGVEVLAIVAPLVAVGIHIRDGYKFEESGAYTSTTFKSVLGMGLRTGRK